MMYLLAHAYLFCMNDLHAYLNLPPSERLYSVGMALFQKYGLQYPDIAGYAPKLSAGPRGTNPDTLLMCLKDVLDRGEPVKPEPVGTEIKALTSNKTRREIDTQVKVRKLRHERMQASQSFHLYSSDHERALVCDLIDKINKEIEFTLRKEEFIKKEHNYTFQIKPGVLDEEISDDIDACMKQRDRATAFISKYEAKIQHLLDQTQTKQRILKREIFEDQINQLLLKKQLIKRHITSLRKLQKNEETTQ